MRKIRYNILFYLLWVPYYIKKWSIYLESNSTKRALKKMGFPGGRGNVTPIKCYSCDWKGRRAWTIHTYRPNTTITGDVEPIDKCPKCENVI